MLMSHLVVIFLVKPSTRIKNANANVLAVISSAGEIRQLSARDLYT